jgi:cytoskeletal protein RodZ
MKTLAEALVNERNMKEISLEFVSQKTNIKIRALEALERGDFENLPGKFYFRNYIKSYLHAIGGDEKDFFDQYGDIVNRIAFKTNEEEDVSYPKLKYSRFRKRSIVLSLVVIAVILVVSATAYYVYTGKKNPFRGWQIFGSGTSAVTQLYIPADALHIDAPVDNFSLDRWPAQVKIIFLQNCWTQVIQGNNKIVEQVYQKGDTANFRGYRFQVTIGNPAGVKFILNGKELTYLKTLPRSERIVINPTTIKGLMSR